MQWPLPMTSSARFSAASVRTNWIPQTYSTVGTKVLDWTMRSGAAEGWRKTVDDLVPGAPVRRRADGGWNLFYILHFTDYDADFIDNFALMESSCSTVVALAFLMAAARRPWRQAANRSDGRLWQPFWLASIRTSEIFLVSLKCSNCCEASGRPEMATPAV
jgi:hypothetical protein